MNTRNKSYPSTVIKDIADKIAFPVEAADFPEHKLRWRHQRWAEMVGLGELSDEDWIAHFGRFQPLPGNLEQPLALAYHGHQFGNYNPEIGDGRGFLFAQLKDKTGRVLDLGTKGSGQTPFSRFGDGRLTLKGGVREVYAANMLEAQGVYTSKPFSLIETGEQLSRHDEPSPTRSSVLVRLSHSHIRFGTFQRLAYNDDKETLARLVNHCVEHYWPDIEASDIDSCATALLVRVRDATARMIAGWMAAGFVHGVMNTDNMTITGESFDYGPWRFLSHADPEFTAAYFDEGGRYKYGSQPSVGLWNLTRLAECLTLVASTPALESVLNGYPSAYGQALRDQWFSRLGLGVTDLQTDLEFVHAMMTWLANEEAPFEAFFFDWFCGEASKDRALSSERAELYKADEFTKIRIGLEKYSPVRPERLNHDLFQSKAPPTLTIEEVETDWSSISQRDDWGAFYKKLNLLEELRLAYAL